MDLSDISNGTITEQGFFDSHPSNNNAGYEGIWSLYPYFESGNIILSDREGFFVVRDPLLATNDLSQSSLKLFPNPTTGLITIDYPGLFISNINIFDVSGKLIFSDEQVNANAKNIDISSFSNGIYFIQINRQFTKKVIKN